MAAIQSSTVRTKYNTALAFAEQMRTMIEGAGLTVEGQAIEMTLKQYGGQEIEIEDGEVITLTAENFDEAIRTESDRLAVKAAEILKDFEGRVAPLMEQLKAVWKEAEDALTAEDDRLALPELPEFTYKSGRRGGGGGGGARVPLDFSADEYVKTTGSKDRYTMIVEDRDENGTPTSFMVLGPDSTPIEGEGDDGEETTSFASHTQAKNAVCAHAGISRQVNARVFWSIPEAK